MAVLDKERNVVVLRVVYDGPASAGKTTTVRALADRLGRPTSTPETAGERTLYFDWLDYTGGLFEGYQLRCQVVSVPGQAMLAHRRDYLLSTADSIVYVNEINERTLDETVSAIERVAAARPSIGVLLQANKRDLPEATPSLAIRDALATRGLRVGLVESVATDGIGVRESFVFAVRLALDHVREQIRLGTLEGRAEIDDAESLLSHMRGLDPVESTPAESAGHPSLEEVLRERHTAEGELSSGAQDESPPQPAAAEVLEEVVREEHASRVPSVGNGSPLALDLSQPEPPDERVPSGLIWPPIDGRLHLADAAAERPRLAMGQGGWRASTDRGWRFFSHLFSVYRDPDDGRGALIQVARTHALHADVLSGPRCVVLARDGHDRWRLWQIVRERVSLRERLAASLDERDASKIAALFVDTARRLIELDERLRRVANTPLRASLDSAGVFMGSTQLVGFVPESTTSTEAPRLRIEAEFAPIVRDWAPRRGEIILALKRAAASASGAEFGVMQRLAAVLEG